VLALAVVAMDDHDAVMMMLFGVVMMHHDEPAMMLVVALLAMMVMNLDNAAMMIAIAIPVVVLAPTDIYGDAGFFCQHHRLVVCRSSQRGRAQDCQGTGDQS
jgi:hypothetical protein